MAPTFREWALGIAVAAVIIPTVTLGTLWIARRLARAISQAIARAFAQVVIEVMAPDMAHIGTKISTSLDELRITNTAQHDETAARLHAVEGRQTDVESRLAAVESKLGMRPPDARTRSSDTEGT